VQSNVAFSPKNEKRCKKNVDFILLVFNCKKYEYKALKQRETWLKDVSIPYFHVQGDQDIDSDYLFDYENHYLYVKVFDDYNSLPKKVIAAYNAVNQEYVFKYIFKTDDDQDLTTVNFLTTLQKILVTKVPKIHYGGHIVNVDKPYLSQYYKIHDELPKWLPVLATRYCSGRFYFLSDLAIEQLITKTEVIGKEYLEDYAIGYNLEPSLKTTMLSLQTNKYFIDNY
jgi:hypothetical protein